MKATRLGLILLGLLLLVVAALVLRTMFQAGSFKTLQAKYPGACREFGGVLSSEDAVYHRASGTLLISSADRFSHFSGQGIRQGAIVGFRPAQPEAGLVDLTAGADLQLNPHGIALYEGPDGRASLFVVNHRSDGEFVEIFDYASTGLRHRASVSGELMTSPNDVAPVSHSSFYVTNDHAETSGFMRTIEEYGQMAWSYLLFYDGERFRKAAEGFKYANGVNLSRDGKVVYLAAVIERGIHVFDRDPASNALSHRNFIFLNTGVDNVEVDAEGDIWTGAHPKLLTFVAHMKDPRKPAPSEVLRIHQPASAEPTVEQVLLDLGDKLGGSSIAVPFEGQLMVGSVMEPRFLVCDMADG